MGHPGLRPLTGRAPAPTNSEGFSEPHPDHRQSSKTRPDPGFRRQTHCRTTLRSRQGTPKTVTVTLQTRHTHERPCGATSSHPAREPPRPHYVGFDLLSCFRGVETAGRRRRVLPVIEGMHWRLTGR